MTDQSYMKAINREIKIIKVTCQTNFKIGEKALSKINEAVGNKDITQKEKLLKVLDICKFYTKMIDKIEDEMWIEKHKNFVNKQYQNLIINGDMTLEEVEKEKALATN